MYVELLNYTPRPEVQVARAARLCYYGSDIDQLKETMTPVKSAELVRKLVKMGHLSTVEHVTFTFGIAASRQKTPALCCRTRQTLRSSVPLTSGACTTSLSTAAATGHSGRSGRWPGGC